VRMAHATLMASQDYKELRGIRMPAADMEVTYGTF
jgi:hypothetical protein